MRRKHENIHICKYLTVTIQQTHHEISYPCVRASIFESKQSEDNSNFVM